VTRHVPCPFRRVPSYSSTLFSDVKMEEEWCADLDDLDDPGLMVIGGQDSSM